MRNCPHRVCLALIASIALTSAAVADQEQTKLNKAGTKVETFSIPNPVRFEFSRNVAAGRLIKTKEGKKGFLRRTYRLITSNGKVVSKELLKEERTSPQPTVFLMGRAGFNASRGAYVRSKVLRMRATAYDPSPATIGPGATGRTYTGMKATYGIVAVDPRVIPLGTLVFVEGYGFAIAADKGSAIKGNRIDLCYDSRWVANQYGVKKVNVHIMQYR